MAHARERRDIKDSFDNNTADGSDRRNQHLDEPAKAPGHPPLPPAPTAHPRHRAFSHTEFLGASVANLGEDGQAFFDALLPSIVKHPVLTRALILEAAHVVDRLAALDDVVTGKGVLDLLRFRLVDQEGKVAEVKFDGVLSEARQQQGTLATLMKTITPNLDASAGAAKERDVLDEIAARRAARGGATARARRAEDGPS